MLAVLPSHDGDGDGLEGYLHGNAALGLFLIVGDGHGGFLGGPGGDARGQCPEG